MHMKLFCSSPSQRRQILINPFSEKDIKSSSNPWAAVHIKFGTFLHVHNHRKHYFLLKQIVLQSFECFECRNIFLFLHLISHWFDTCGCITIIIFPSNFLSVPKIKPKELFNNFGLFKSSGNLALSSGATNVSHTDFWFASNDFRKLGIVFAISYIPPTPLLCTRNFSHSCFLDDTYYFILYYFITGTILPVSEVCLDKHWKFLS